MCVCVRVREQERERERERERGGGQGEAEERQSLVQKRSVRVRLGSHMRWVNMDAYSMDYGIDKRTVKAKN